MTAIEAPRATCPAVGRLPTTRSHGGFSAAKEDGCTCPGEGQESYRAYKRRQGQRTRANAPSTGRVTAPPFHSPAVPEPAYTADELDEYVCTHPLRACEGMDVNEFFPVGASGQARVLEHRAKVVCWTCPVKPECLEAAIRRGEDYGIFGGTTPAERRQIKAERAGWAT